MISTINLIKSRIPYTLRLQRRLDITLSTESFFN